MKRADAPWIGANPGDRVGAGLEACADVELKHDRRLRILSENFDRAHAIKPCELRLMIVIARFESGWFQLLSNGVQFIGEGLPAIGARFRVCAGHNHVLAAQDQVPIAGTMNVLQAEVWLIIVGGETMDAQVIKKLAHLFGLTFAPLEIRSVE